jgi:hypothetical protein
LPDETVEAVQHLARNEGVTVTEAFVRAIGRQQLLDREVMLGNKILLEKDSFVKWLATGGRTGKTYREVKLPVLPRTLCPTEKNLLALGCSYTRQDDGYFLVKGNIDLSYKNLTRLPDLSRAILTESFFCHNNALTSLEGAPRAVGLRFSASSNRLTDLKGAPRFVGEDFSVAFNDLVTLEGAPQTVTESFNCDNNPRLASLKHAPVAVGYLFECRRCALADLEHLPLSFHQVESDFGKFKSWSEIPTPLAPETKARREQETIRAATELQTNLPVSKPLRLRKGP